MVDNNALNHVRMSCSLSFLSTYVVRNVGFFLVLLIWAKFVLLGATMEPFGSFVSQLFSCWGDLDLSYPMDYTLQLLPGCTSRLY